MSKFKLYYKADAETSVALFTEWDSDVRTKRTDAHQALLAETGAVAWREQSHWNSPTTICELVFDNDHPSVFLGYVKVSSRDHYQGKLVASLRGKLNSKGGKAFNTPIDVANEELKGL